MSMSANMARSLTTLMKSRSIDEMTSATLTAFILYEQEMIETASARKADWRYSASLFWRRTPPPRLNRLLASAAEMRRRLSPLQSARRCSESHIASCRLCRRYEMSGEIRCIMMARREVRCICPDILYHGARYTASAASPPAAAI